VPKHKTAQGFSRGRCIAVRRGRSPGAMRRTLTMRTLRRARPTAWTGPDQSDPPQHAPRLRVRLQTQAGATAGRAADAAAVREQWRGR
jgi:hypothetical protein